MNNLRIVFLLLPLLGFSACATAPAMDPIATMVKSNCPWYKTCVPHRWEQDFADKWHRDYGIIEKLQDKYDSDISDTKKVIRNDYINEMFAMIDEEHLQYQASIRMTRSFSDFYMDIGVLGLTAAGAVVGGAPTKAILSAAAAALTGTKIAVNKAFFEEAAISTLLNQMDSARNTKKLAIRNLMGNDVLEYPLSYARADMLEYLFSGSIISAVKTLAEDSAIKKFATSGKLESQRPASTTTNQSSPQGTPGTGTTPGTAEQPSP